MTRRFRRFVAQHPAMPDFAGRAVVVAVTILLVYALFLHSSMQFAR